MVQTEARIQTLRPLRRRIAMLAGERTDQIYQVAPRKDISFLNADSAMSTRIYIANANVQLRNMGGVLQRGESIVSVSQDGMIGVTSNGRTLNL